MSSCNNNSVSLPASLTTENLLQVIATLSDHIRKLESGSCASASASRATQNEDEVPPQVVAVIAAAIHATAGARARIVRMTPLHEKAAWSAEGRRSIFGSHSVR